MDHDFFYVLAVTFGGIGYMHDKLSVSARKELDQELRPEIEFFSLLADHINQTYLKKFNEIYPNGGEDDG